MSEACEYCGKVYYTEDMAPSQEYMRHGHIIMECESPDQMEKAWLNASPWEKEHTWPIDQ